MKGGVRRLIRRALGGDEEHYRSPQEIALRNAADSLGVALGEDYFDDLGLNDIPVDLPGTADSARADAFREELVAYIEGRANERKRHRRARVLKFGVAGAVVGGAVVLSAAITREEPSKPTGDARLSLPRYVGTGVGFARGGMGAVTTMPAIDGGDLVHSTYRDVHDNVCLSTAQVKRGITRNETRGNCVEPGDFFKAIRRRPAFFTGGAGARGYVLVSGYGRADLARIVADDSRVRIESAITPTFYPGANAPDNFAVKAFLVRIWLGPGVRFASPMHLMADPRTLELTAIFTNGDRSPVEDLDVVLNGPRPPVRIPDWVRQPLKYSDCVALFPGEKLPAGKTRC
jgi:hypothetical protein